MGKTNIWLQLREAVQAIDDAWLRAFLFAHIGRIWPQAGERIYWSDALAALEQVLDENDRTTLLARFATALPEGLYERACNLIEQVTWSENRVRLLLAYVPLLPPEAKNGALVELMERLVELEPGLETTDLLATLIPHLSEVQRMEAVEMIKGQPDLWNQAQKIRPFLPYLQTQDRQKVVSQIIFRCRRLKAIERFRVMAEVAPYLPEPKLRELVDGFRELDDDTSCIVVLERTAEVLPEAQLGWVWDGIQSIWNKNRRAWLICHLFQWLPSQKQPVALAEIRNTLKLSPERDAVMLSIRNEVPDIFLVEMLDMVTQAEEAARVEILDGLLAGVPDELLAEFLDMALDIGRSDLRYARLELLNRLSTHLIDWANVAPEDARQSWQILFARRKREHIGSNGNGTNGNEPELAQTRAELLVDLTGLLPFFLHFIPANHQPAVAVQLIEELRRHVTGPKLMRLGRKVEEPLIG